MLAFSAYRLLSRLPIYTIPLATAGEEYTLPPVANIHTSAPVLAFSAYRLPSKEPINTTPFATAGEPSILSPVV